MKFRELWRVAGPGPAETALTAYTALAHADPHTAYQAGYRNAFTYWSEGVTITSHSDIEATAETRAYRNGYLKMGPDRDAFIKGWVAATVLILHKQR